MLRSTQDSRAELTRLMETYGTDLLRLCTLYLKDATLAQDAVQDAFLRAWQHLDTWRGQASEKTWLTRIAINVCKDYQRSAWTRHHDRRVEPGALPDQAIPFAAPDDTVIAAVMRLPEKCRAAILLRYYQNLRLEEVAAVLGVSRSTVKQRLRKAHTLLRDSLEEWYDEDE